MPRGRPPRSEIRQRLIDIIAVKGPCYGYELYKVYKAIYPRCTLEVVYYHLKKAAKSGELKVAEIKQEKGAFSWGPVSEKIIYELGPQAKPRNDHAIADYIRSLENL